MVDPAALPQTLTLHDRLHVFTTSREAWWSNHVFFQTERLGLVVYDVPILNTHGRALWEAMGKVSSGRVGLFVVSHGHPDHWGSLDVLSTLTPDTPILAASETAAYMSFTAEGNLELTRRWQPELGGIPDRVVMPTELFDGEKVIDAGDLTLRFHTTGPGEDTEHTVLHLPELGTILVNDLVYNGWHPWNEEERDGHWLRVLEQLRGFGAHTVVPGHGPVGGPELYDAMELWLRTFQDLRLRYAGRYSLRDMPVENRERMIEELKALFPDWYDDELPFSCGQTLALPYSYGPNRYGIDRL
jgi:cyclase